MPFIPFSTSHRVSVRDGLRAYLPLANRHKSHVAIPEYVIAHHDGKRTVPLEFDGTSEFIYTNNSSGNPIVKFKNWKGDWCEYLDIKEEPRL